VERMAPAAP